MQRDFDADEPPSILAKAVDVLRAFNGVDRVMSLTEIARAAHLPKSTAHRVLMRLVRLDAVEAQPAGYRLSVRIVEMGAYTPAAALRDIALARLVSLNQRTNLTVHLGVLRGGDVVLLERIGAFGALVGHRAVGDRLPANCTAMGKALLAGEADDALARLLPAPMPALTEHSVTDLAALHLVGEPRLADAGQLGGEGGVRETGFAYEVEEAERGVACVAAPIIVRGATTGAVSLSRVAPWVWTDEELALLTSAGTAISRDTRSLLDDRRRKRWFPH